ncbi:MAG: FtsX-like permease family protein, partial [Terriglobales bacterium]
RLPGVTAATLASGAPMAAITGGRGYQLYGQASSDPRMRIANIESIAPESFFRTMRIPLLRGRDFRISDNAAAPRVMIVNQTFARTAWPGEDAIGKRVLFHDEDAPTMVVGVARDSTYNSLAEGPVTFAYLPLAQEPATAMALAVRTAGPPAAMLEAMRHTVLSVNSELAITQLQPATVAVEQSLWAARMGATLLGLLSALATLLAALGIYGVAAYEVRQRWRELAIRMALGARRSHVFASVLRRGLTPVLAGLAAGIVAAVTLGHLAASLLFDIAPADPGVIAGYVALFVGVALLALLLPARVAMQADPAVILKETV